MTRRITRALISVYYKEGLEPVIKKLAQLGVRFVSTGGTQEFIAKMGFAVTPVEELTGYPSIFGGRVKTLHPAVFGGILYRRENAGDVDQAASHHIDGIDLVIVDLYPFEETVAKGGSEEEIIEKIDIGGISLIRAAAKNFQDVLIVSSREQYEALLRLLEEGKGSTRLAERRHFASLAFDTTSHYDTAIFNYFNSGSTIDSFRQSYRNGRPLRYGENPHQKARFFGDLDGMFDQLNGKELSYNNLVDVDAALALLGEFQDETAFVIVKHTNACGVATAATVKDAYLKAFEADTLSAFGGILVTNGKVDLAAAESMNSLFFEILVAPDYEETAVTLLRAKKNRILLRQKQPLRQPRQFKSLLNGVLEQEPDSRTDSPSDLKEVTRRAPSESEVRALLFASKIAKHTKSNTIVLAEEGRLLASGVGQTSRVDALRQAIAKAKSFGFSLEGAVMASDAFFPFPDCVEIAHGEGIKAVIQPGGSVKDQDSIDFCDRHGMAMVFTGLRHFKH
jgi:phosphoribosylaminoimidazolecarboxamide formyltransferase/IMP cyclohydrolase